MSSPNEPIHKRRRVTRACDECRKKKVKCDGRQPCVSCTVYSFECTYNQTSTRRRQRSPSLSEDFSEGRGSQHCKALEDKVFILEQALSSLLPTLSEGSLNVTKLMNSANKLRASKDDSQITLKEVLDLYGKDQQSMPNDRLIRMNHPEQNVETPIGMEIKIILPPYEVAIDLVSKTWENACVLFRFYHRPSFISDLNELYETDVRNYTNKQQRFLPLVYAVMACGSLFHKSDKATKQNSENLSQQSDQQTLLADEGYKYFIAARKLIDITDTRDTYGMQTILMLIIFLQCSARLSTCYSYIGIALRAALREGLHRKLNHPFSAPALEVRKALFWTIYKMDVYVNTMLGLPGTISEDDFDQELPYDLDDENICPEGLYFDRQKGLSSAGIANAHTRLICLMKQVVQKLYPVKTKQPDDCDINLLSHNKVYELELGLQDWVNQLPLELKPGIEPPQKYFKANRYLHLSYLHVKITLYRPFIHYLSASFLSQGDMSPHDMMCIEKAKNCINVARIVVKLAQDMINKQALCGSYWFSIYTIYFSVACLVFYIHFSPSVDSSGNYTKEYLEIRKDAAMGKWVLDVLKDSNTAARRTHNVLGAIFEKLNQRAANITRNPRPEPVPSVSSTNDSPADVNTITNGVNFIDGIKTGVDITRSHPTASAQPSSVPPGKYMPGVIDQLDMKIFGRFLPPYMLNDEDPADATQFYDPVWPDSNITGTRQSFSQPETSPGLTTVPSGLSTTMEKGSLNYLPEESLLKQEGGDFSFLDGWSG